MVERYRRASRLTAPKLASEVPDVARDGYWLDDERFFFVAETAASSGARVVPVPSILDMRNREVSEVVPLQTLARVLSEHSGESIGVDALADAEFDMPAPATLGVCVTGHDYLIDVTDLHVSQRVPSMPVPSLYSPDGRYACFVRGHDVWLRDRHTGAERALTTDGQPHFCYGQESEACLWSLSYRQCPRPAGVWSPDSQWFLTHQIDERSVPELALVQHVPPGGGRPRLHRYKYPVPGDPLPRATFVAIHVASVRCVVFEDGPTTVPAFSPFFMRQVWFSEPEIAWVVRMDRYCRRAELVRLDLAAGAARVVLTEAAETGYLDLNPLLGRPPNVRVLAATHEIIWFSERSGWGHLYLHDALTGELKNAITHGAWGVRDMVHVDERMRRVFFLAAALDPSVDPARRSLCAVNLDGSDFEVLRGHDGDLSMARNDRCGVGQDHPFRPADASPGLSPCGRYGVLRSLSVSRGDRVDVVDLQDGRGFRLASMKRASAPSARAFNTLASDGVTRIHGVMFLPTDFDESKCYPLIDYIYPGPQKAQQPQAYMALGAAQALSLAELGFVTIMLDTRGAPVGSRAFHQAGYGELLEPQLADHAAAVRELCARHSFIDADRIGMLGWSGGGHATARALFDYGDLFKVGVAVCGDHDPSAYAAFWSDKYRGPGMPEDFARQANAAVAGKLTGKLLLISGDMDDNVHPAQTLGLVDALIRANKDFDLLIVPNEDHYVLTTSGYAQRRVWDYFVTHLMRRDPPREFELRFSAHEIARFHRRFWNEIRQ